MIATGLIELGFTVAGPLTGDSYDALVLDTGDGDGPQIVEWRSQSPQPSSSEIEAAAAASEARRLRRKIRKSVVQARLIDAGKMDAAYTALTSNSAYFARWFAPDHPEVYADDSDALILLRAIGADPKTIMAP